MDFEPVSSSTYRLVERSGFENPRCSPCICYSEHSVISPTFATIDENLCAAPAASEITGPIGVLIVDDEESVRQVLALGLHAHGFVVWLAGNSVTALELYRSHHNAI